MGYKIVFGIVLIFNFISTSVFAQDFNFEHITSNQGLSQQTVNSIIQDKSGFMWFGTMNGLNKFDGYNFVKYYHNPDDSSSVAGDQINCILEDSKGELWIGSDGGLSLYDRNLDVFVNFEHNENDPGSIGGQRVYCIYEDRMGHIWVGVTGAGLNLFDRKEMKFTHYLHIENDDKTISSNDIRAIIEDNDGGIWAATEAGLNHLNIKSQTFTHFRHDENDHSSISHNNITSLIKDNSGTIWLGTLGGGLCRMYKDMNGKYRFETFTPKSKDLARTKILTAAAGSQNRLWIGTENGGLDCFDISLKTFTNYQFDENKPGSLNNNSIHSILEDKTGNFWVGTYTGGINVYKKNKKKFYTYSNIPGNTNSISYNAVSCFFENNDGNLWIGTDGGGVNQLNRKTGKFIHFNSSNTSLSSNAVLTICKDSEDEIWVGGWECGLNLFNSKNNTFANLSSVKDGLTNNNIFDLLVDHKGQLWMAFGGIGFARYDKKSKTFITYTPTNSGLLSPWILNLAEDFSGKIILGHTNGFSIFNPENETFENYFRNENDKNSLSNDQINIILPVHDSTLWIGTANGLNHFNQKTHKFTRFYEQNGLPSNNITGLVEDNSGYIWISTANGISKFDPKSGSFKNYNLADGLQGKSFIRNSCFKTSKGEILFGGTNGFNLFSPDSLFDNPNLPKVVITDFTIFNKPVKVGEPGSPLSEHISVIRQMELQHKQSVFTFEFVALDYTAPQQNQYAYIMEGFEKEWNYVGNKREATYTNLNSGEYTFRVKASNNDGVWNEDGASIEIKIFPPWWGTWWFRFIATFSLISVLTYIVYVRVQYFKNQKILLEKLVAQKTSELQQMNTMLVKQAKELNVTNSLLEKRKEQIEEQSEELMAQKESLVAMNNELHDLNATKDKFFSIIAHDIKNPFNAILGFTELLAENFKEWTDDMKLEIINLVLASSQNLYQLLENLLQWSRSQRGIIEFKPQEIVLKDSIQNVIDLMKGTAEAKNIELGFTLPEIGLAVIADRQMLDTIIRNLVNNALKFTNTGGKVRITAEMIDGYVNIEVIDNGVGMKSDIKDKLFKIDSNHTTTGTANEIGSGLGLILVKEFVTRHGGEIGVDSIVGEGSTFHFTLPLAK